MRGTHRTTLRDTLRRKTVPIAIGAVIAAVLPVILLATAQDANATDPQQVNFTQEGCRNNGGITLPNGSGKFICPDSAYTTGNLGKGWNELDLVPLRVTVDAGTSAPATQTYTFAITADSAKSGVPGYDFLSVPVLNTTLSSASCTAATTGAQQTTGTTTQSIYRLVTVTQLRNTTCVYDYYARLALGSHLYNGSSLHVSLLNENLGTAGVGGKDVSIPVNEIAPQELSKDMTATQDSDHVWDVTKSATPASLPFSNTCDPTAPLSAAVAVTVTWTREAASPSGDITVITHVYATNPAARAINTSVTDVIKSGTTTLDTVSAGPTTVPANTANFLLLTHQTTVPSGTTNLNDVATGTYTDTVTGIPIPGTTTATASATVQTGNELNASATINDVESITGTGLTFSVDSTSGASGSFDGGYVAGTHTTGPVSWTSDSQSGDGSVTLNKTVYATAATVDSTGQLSDTATVTGSDGFSNHYDLDVDVTTNATTSLDVSKSATLQFASNKTYTFHLIDANTNTATGDTTTVTIPAGSTGPVASSAITGLSPTGSYKFHEDANAPFPAHDTSPVTFSLVAGDISTCSATISVTNNAAPSTARVQKITLPTSSGNWTFTLTGPGNLSETLTNVTANAGFVPFASTLDVDGGTYTITETQQTGYDLTSVTGQIGARTASTSTANKTCSITLDLAQDSGNTLSCTFTNTKRGTIIVKKVTNPTGAAGSFTFTGDAHGSIGDGQTITVSDLAPGTYTSTEADPTPAFDLTGISCDDGSSTTASTVSLASRTATFKLDPGEIVTCTFTNRQRGHVHVVKTVNGQPPTGSQSYTFQLRTGASANSAGTILETLTANAGNGGLLNFVTNLVPGTTYQLCEQMQAGWLTSLGPPIYSVYNPSGDNSVVCTDFTVAAGETKTFAIDNTPPPGGMALTIGYWKNWSSCTGGKQKAVLDQKLLAAANAGAPITLGLLVLDPNVLGAATACQYAVNILNKTTIDGKKKMSSDPLFNMAAQLLAADLNVVSGAGTCAASTSAITQAHALLDKYKFDGKTYTPKLTSADATLANFLASQLDKYNNNKLC
jgi:hypothetical protein